MLFNEYEIKKFGKRITVRYERTEESSLNPWTSYMSGRYREFSRL